MLTSLLGKAAIYQARLAIPRMVTQFCHRFCVWSPTVKVRELSCQGMMQTGPLQWTHYCFCLLEHLIGSASSHSDSSLFWTPRQLVSSSDLEGVLLGG